MPITLDKFMSMVSLVDVPDSVEIMVDASRARLFGTLDELAAISRLVVDRPASSRHPRVPEAVYPRRLRRPGGHRGRGR